VNPVQLQRALDDVFDQALVYHAFTRYMRDYEAIVYATADPRTGIQPAYLRYLFRYCVVASVESTVAAHTWRRSLDERLIRYDTGVELDGYVWGVNWHALYPGMTAVSPSARAEKWSTDIGVDFHEVHIETNAHKIGLIFSELEVTKVTDGYAPFVVTAEQG
jgi:hypothetical protein